MNKQLNIYIGLRKFFVKEIAPLRLFVKSLIVLTIALTFLLPPFTAMAKDWGLGFPNPGSKPNGNETADYLKKYDAYFVGESDEKVIYLTFDAGYENGQTKPILDTLKENNVPAAFFLVGSYIKSQPDIISRMLDEGHIIANHTTTHPDMTTLDDNSFAEELSKTEEIYKDVTEQTMKKYYRPPQGKYSESNLQAAKDLGYKTIFWSLAYRDFEDSNQPSKEQAFSKLLPRVHSGAIILLHSTSKTNAVILGELIAEYKKMGYTFKSLDELQ